MESKESFSKSQKVIMSILSILIVVVLGGLGVLIYDMYSIKNMTVYDAYSLVKEGNINKANRVLVQYPSDELGSTVEDYIYGIRKVDSLTMIDTETYIELIELTIEMLDIIENSDESVFVDELYTDTYALRRQIMEKSKLDLGEMLPYLETAFINREYDKISTLIIPFTVFEGLEYQYENRNDDIDVLDMIAGVLDEESIMYGDRERMKEVPYPYTGILEEEITQAMIQFFGSSEEWNLAYEEYVKEEKEYQQMEANVEAYNARKQAEEDAKPKIGMTAAEVRNSSWGNPSDINRTTNKYGVSEQWIYDGRYKGYIYLDDGIVTTIQER